MRWVVYRFGVSCVGYVSGWGRGMVSVCASGGGGVSKEV